MKIKNIYSILCVSTLLFTTSCSDYLETSSPSVVDADFVFSNSVTARAALSGAYSTWRSTAGSCVFGDGLYYAIDITGSDIERFAETFAAQTGRNYMANFYQNGKFAASYDPLTGSTEGANYNDLYNVIGKCNAIITSMKGSSNYKEIIENAKEPSILSQMYGEAIALRATAYRELIKYYGDVPYSCVFGQSVKGLSPRDSIYDVCLEELQQVEPLMYPVGSIPGIDKSAKNYMSQTYVCGLIGRMALEAGGYQTRRGAGDGIPDVFYKDGKGEVLSFEKIGNTNNNGAVYERRSDWKNLYEIAKTYFKKAIDNPGSAIMHFTDPRAAEKNGRVYNNPYQYFFQQMHEGDVTYADESIYEYPQQINNENDPRPYALGRPSSGGGKKNYPCKSFGRGRINPAFYYGMFDPNDKRRDVSCAITGSNGKGVEVLIPFFPNSKAVGGGISCNKWDENRQTEPNWLVNRKSGINGPYMRMPEVYLGYAEACAALGDDVTAKSYLEMIRQRSFPAGKDNTNAFIASCGNNILKAVIEERGFEFAGEGDRRFTLIRSGFLPEDIKKIKTLTHEMIEGLKTNGYYKFENGNVISNYVWTKLVDLKATNGYRLTAQTPEGKENDPVLSPGWRGQNDSWEDFGMDYKGNTKTNLAIEGLFRYIDPEGEEASALKADGYEMVPWGKSIVDYQDEYDKYLFWDYDYVSAPIHLVPFTPNVCLTGGFKNGYGFKNE